MNSGKYAVFPGDNYMEHVAPFIVATKLDGKTKTISSVMSSYSIALDGKGESLMGDRVGSAYNKEKMDVLRRHAGFEGVICTDWGVTKNEPSEKFSGMAWGAESFTVAERHYIILLCGSDMFGGNNATAPVLEAYDIWERAYQNGGLEISAEERFQRSAKPLLMLMFNTKLFENPYLIMEESKAAVASDDKVKAGYNAQLSSVVMLKNKGQVIKPTDVSKDYKDKVVYIPSSIIHNFESIWAPANTETGATMDLETAKLYFKEVVTDIPVKDKDGNITGYKSPDLSSVDIAIVGMRSPLNGNIFSSAGLKDGVFYPLSLQYGAYKADGKNVRKVSISGDIISDNEVENRSYLGKTSIIANEYDLTAFKNTVVAVRDAESKTKKKIPVIVALKAINPVVAGEFEKDADAVVVGFSVSDKALYDIILGAFEPRGLLPLQFPADMDTVEAQYEDVAFDMIPYIDSEGNRYDFTFGLNYKGVINDDRTAKYLPKNK